MCFIGPSGTSAAQVEPEVDPHDGSWDLTLQGNPVEPISAAQPSPLGSGVESAHQIIRSIMLLVFLEPSRFFHSPKQIAEVTVRCIVAQKAAWARKNANMSCHDSAPTTA